MHDIQIFESIIVENNEEKTAENKIESQNATDEIETRAREALKAAGLEGKNAPSAHYTQIYKPSKDSVWFYVHVYGDKNNNPISPTIKSAMARLHKAVTGESDSTSYPDDSNGVIHYFDSEEEAQTFEKALNIYFSDAREKDAAKKAEFEKNFDTYVDKRANEALKATGLDGETISTDFTAKVAPQNKTWLILRGNEDALNFDNISDTNVKDAVHKLEKFFDTQATGIGKKFISYRLICKSELDAQAFEKALNIYFGNYTDVENVSRTGTRITDGIANLALENTGIKDNTSLASFTVEVEGKTVNINFEDDQNKEKTLEDLDELASEIGVIAVQNNDNHSSYKFSNEDDAAGFAKALERYGGNKNESGKLGTRTSVNDGHTVLQSEVRTATDEGTRQEGRTALSENISGQERRTLRRIEDNDTGTNAESQRSDETNGTGSTSARTGTGNGLRGSEGVVQSAAGDKRGNGRLSENVSNVGTKRHNFRITDDNNEIGSGGLKEKFRQNFEAVKLLKQIESEGRFATPEEQKVLAKFNGWGTLADAFVESKKDWQKEHQQLKELLTEDEYKAAKAAITNAFYTSPKVARAIWTGLQRLGFKGGRILDPSMGSGIFFGTMPAEISKNSELTGVELDDLTGRISKQLYQNAAIDIMGFQDRKMANNYFDVAITNVPFSNDVHPYDPEYKKQNYNLHNFFFAKAMDKVRPGGFVAFITSIGTMQSSESQKLRTEISRKADLIAAFKLPSNAFDKNAATQVTTDVLILQKRLDPLKPSEHAQSWQEMESIKVKSGDYSLPLPVNEYFSEHPENMIGKPVKDKLYGGYGNVRLALDGTGIDVEKEFLKLMQNLPENILVPLQTPKHDSLKNTRKIIADSEIQNFSFTEKDKKFYQRNGDELVEVESKNQSMVKDYLPLMKSVHNILNAQLTPEITDKKLSELRQTLNKNYDKFVKKHGYLNAQKNRNILGSDPNYGTVASIEDYHYDKKTKKESAKKADIFLKRTVSPTTEPVSAESVEEGLQISLSMRGRLDMDYIHQLTGKTENEIIKELGDLIYKNPETGTQELAEEYLSGNVREKLSFAKEAAKNNPEFKRNVEALEKVLPRDLNENEINVRLGSTFIDTKYYEDFIRHMIGYWKDGEVIFNPTNGQYIVGGYSGFRENTALWGMPGNSNWTFLKILEKIMNYATLRITHEGKTDDAETAAVNEKAQKIQEEFEKWIWADETRKQDILRTYNDRFNSEVERRYDGKNLKDFPGLTDNIREKLYPHQKDIIYRNLQGGNTLIGHCVGAGKTLSMVISGMRMKQLGLIRKPLFAVPNNIVKQFEREFLQAYPSAKLLVLDSKSLPLGSSSEGAIKETEEQKEKRRAKRRMTLSRIATGDWDGIIISHEMFEKLPLSPETYKSFAEEQIALLEAEKRADFDSKLDNWYSNRSGQMPSQKRFEKALENAIADLREDIERMTDKDSKELVMPFEELGIDQIFVDESDLFKNLRFVTNIQGKGISTTGSKRAWDLFTKTRWLSKQRNGGGVIFATGTPVSNTLNEIFTLQRFLDYDGLGEKGLQTFGAWVKNFGRLETTVELSASGGGYKATNRVNLINTKSLRTICGKFMDIKMIEDLPHLEKQRPKPEYIQEAIEPSKTQTEYTKEIGDRATAIRNSKIDPTIDNMLKVSGDWRKSSIDMRLIDPNTSEEDTGGKIRKLCDNIFKEFNDTKEIDGTQLVFLDLGTPKGKSEKAKDNSEENEEEDSALTAADMSLYELIREGLILRGIPQKQIAFVHEAKNAEQRQELFDKVNEGKIRIILGSTQKMGAGTNFQKHLVALHHLDCPWRPRDIEQREGRILRKGNLNKNVKIYTYLTKDSSDGYSWEKLKIKQQMITDFLRGNNVDGNEIEAIDDFVLKADEIVALTESNPKIKEKAELMQKIGKLRLLERNHFDNLKRNQDTKRDLERKIPFIEDRLENLKLDAKEKVDTKGDAFRMKIGDVVYTERKDASPAYAEALAKVSGLERQKIGEIGGFNIEASKANGDSVPLVFLKNHGSYNVTGTLQSLERFISGIQREIDDTSVKLERNKKELAAINKQPTKFEKQVELDAAIRKLAEIDAAIKDPTFKPDESSTTNNETIETESEENLGIEKHVWNSLEKDLGITPSNTRDDSKFNLGFTFVEDEELKNTNGYFETLEDAIKAARHIKNNFESVQRVTVHSADKNNREFAFTINENGNERTHTDTAKEIIEKMDAEETKEIQSPADTKKRQSNNSAENLANAAIQAATDWTDKHVILSGFSPELEQTVKNEIIKQQATIGAIDYVDKKQRESLDKLDKASEKLKNEDEQVLRWKDLSDEEKYRRGNITAENLKIDQQLKDTLHKSYPEISEWIDELIDIASKPLVFDRKKDSLIDKAKQKLAEYLKSESMLTKEQKFTVATYGMYNIWETKEIYAKNNVPNKNYEIQRKAKNILGNLKNSPTESYEQILNLLFSKSEKSESVNSETPKIKSSIAECKTFEEIEDYIRNRYHIKIQINRADDLNIDAVRKVLQGVESVVKEFPTVSDAITSIQIANKEGFSIFTDGSVVFNEIQNFTMALDGFYLKKDYDWTKNKTEGRNIAPESLKAFEVGLHESGHIVHFLTLNRLGFAATNFFDKLNADYNAGKISKLELNLDSRVRKANFNYTFDDLVLWAYDSIKDDFKDKSINDLRKEISDYALTNSKETVAESVADYVINKEKAAPLSIAIWKKLKAALETDEWINHELLSHTLEEGKQGKLNKFKVILSNKAVMAWYSANKNKNNDNLQLRHFAEQLLADRELAAELEKITSESEWENLLQSKIPNEYVLKKEGELSDEKIFEMAKNSNIRAAIESLGGHVEENVVSYDDEDSRNAVKKFLQNNLHPVSMYSVKLSRDESIEIAKMDKFLAPEELTDKQKATAEFGKQMGVSVIYFKGNKKFHGAHSNGITYLNVDSETSHDWTFWHESFHWLAENNPALFKEIADNVKISQKQLDDYRKEIGRKNLSDAETIEEILADNMKDTATRLELFRQVGKKNKSLLERFISWLKSVMDKFTDFFNTPKNGLTREQKNKMYETFGKMARSLVDEDGNAIFRFNKRTKEIELSNGDALPQVQFSMRGNSKNVVKVTGDEFGDYADIKELRKKAINYYRENLQGTSVFNAELGRIDIDENGIVNFANDGGKKVISTSPEVQKLLLVKYLPELIRTATNVRGVDTHKERHKDDYFYYMNNHVEINGHSKAIHITLIKRNNGQINFRNLNWLEETENTPVNSAAPVSSNEALGFPPVGVSSNESIPQNEDNGNKKYSARNLTLSSTLSEDEEYLQTVKAFQKAKTDTERRTTYRKLKEMVENAAIKAGFENAIPEQTVAYKVRTTAAPKKTIKVYKVFTVSNDGSPTALFIGGTEKLPQGVWLDAQAAYHFTAKNGLEYVPSTQNPYTKGGKTGASVEIPNEQVRKELIERGFLPKGSTATKVTALAYRPGWHAGTLPFFPQGGIKYPKGTKASYEHMHRRNEVVFECELAADKDYTKEAESQPKARNKDGSLNTRKADLQYMPENGFYYYATNPMTHGHPELGMWVLSGSLKINRALTQEECDEILRENNMAPQEWEQGKINLADLGYTGEQNDAARKTLAPITYDDAGNVIPISQRFDATKNDIRYSINNSDNSFASFREKLAHKFFGESHERFRKQMVDALADLTGYKISSGHLASGDIVVKPNSKVIRTKNAYAFDLILPEVGKIVAGKLNLNPTDEMNNYIANWIFDGATNNHSPESKEFQRAMQNADDDFRDKLFEAQGKFVEWNNKSAMEKAKAIISRRKDEPPMGEKVKSLLDKGYEEFFEDIAPIKNLVDEIEKETGKKIKNSLNPYIAFRNYKGMAGRARMLLEGDETTTKILQETYPSINFKNFKTLKMILDEVGASKNDDIYEDFVAYATACHVKEIHGENKKLDKAIAERKEKIIAAEEELENATTKKQAEEIQKKILFHKDRIDKLQKAKYVTPMTEKECDEIISQNKNRFGKSQQDLVHYSNIMLAIINNAGIQNDFVYNGLLDKWKNYVPLHRLFDENENLAFGDSLKTMEGSARDIIDPIQAIIESTNSFVKRAEKNKAKILLAGLVRCNGVGNLIEEVDGKKPDDKTTITFYEDGVKKYLQTDPAVVRAVNNLTMPQISWFFKVLRMGTNIVRNFMTVYNPNFALRNLMRDPQDAYLYSGNRDKSIADVLRDVYQTPIYVAKGIMHAYKQDEIFNEWMIHGGAQASFWSMDRNYTQVSIDKLTRGQNKNAPLYHRIKNSGAKFLNLLAAFGEYSELGTRLGQYEKVKNILAQQHGGKNTYDDLVTAAYESRDLMDFARGGASSRNWNIYAAFANANLQGVDKFCRTFSYKKLKTPEGKKEFGYAVLRLLISSVVPTIILFALNHDKDWYKNDLNDWERRANWVIGENYRIPKGMDFGTRFVSDFVEDALNYAYNKQPMKFEKTFVEPIIDTLPDIFPTMMQPIFECFANYDLFTRNPIVPRRLQNLPEPLQYDSRTLGIAKFIGEQTGYSPKKVEHLLFGFTGNLGKGILKVGDVALSDKKASMPAADWLPILGSFSRVPYRNPKIVNDYYEKLDEQTKWHNEYKLTGKKPEGYDDALYNRFKKIQKDMQKFSKLERAAIENLNISEDERDRRRMAIQKKRIALIEKVMR